MKNYWLSKTNKFEDLGSVISEIIKDCKYFNDIYFSLSEDQIDLLESMHISGADGNQDGHGSFDLSFSNDGKDTFKDLLFERFMDNSENKLYDWFMCEMEVLQFHCNTEENSFKFIVKL
jgi:hypothetical protein